ncbi:MAG TPA: glycosyltransferase family 39 protein [Gemmatimonadaceae bacterium]
MTRYQQNIARIAVAAFAIRLLLLVARGDYIMYDEGYYLLLSRSLRLGEGFRLNGLPHVALSPLQPVIVAAISVLGVPALWASRLLAAVAGALLVVPAGAIARRVGGARAGVVAATLVAAAPTLMTFVPFFPGESPNLYFGSEPLYLLLAIGAIAAGMRAARGGGVRSWALVGALGAGAFLTRGEGLIVGPLVVLVVAIERLRTGPARLAWRAPAVAVAAAMVCVAPYLLYLRAELGRWALSGRVQAASAATTAPTPAPAGGTTASAAATGSPRRSGSAAEDLVWHGDATGYWNAAYRLDASGTRMRSQYWGVAPRVAPAPALAVADVADVARDSAREAPGESARAGRHDSARATPHDSASAGAAREAGSRGAPAATPRWRLLGRGVAMVLPVWLALLALAGLVVHRRGRRALLWLSPALAAALLPTMLVYVEPRALLPLVPIAAIGAALALEALARELRRGIPDAARRRRLVAALAAAGAAVLVAPAVRDYVRAMASAQPLQQVASSQRAVAHLLDQNLPADAIVASWHPAVAYFADREWRVLPYEPIDRVLVYARAQQVSAIVLSRFEPSPLADPHPFQVLLLDPAGPAPDVRAPHLGTVEETPLVVVRRVLPAEAP